VPPSSFSFLSQKENAQPVDGDSKCDGSFYQHIQNDCAGICTYKYLLPFLTA
jgi:hypothetical protein